MRLMKALALAISLSAPMLVSATESVPFNLSPNGDNLYVASTGDVVLTFLSKDADYLNDLFLAGIATPILNNQSAVSGAQFNLGTFQAGTQLNFSVFVHNTNNTFYNGAASLNPDNQIHAAYSSVIGNSVTIGFEDLFAGGDTDYNDLVFSLNNVYVAAVPEPETYAMLTMGLGLIGWASRRRQSK